MMYQFVHGTSYIPDGTLLPHPPTRYTTLEPVLIFLYPLLEQMPTTTPFFHMSHFWNCCMSTYTKSVANNCNFMLVSTRREAHKAQMFNMLLRTGQSDKSKSESKA